MTLASDLLKGVIRPVLRDLDDERIEPHIPFSEPAARLLLGTALTETALDALYQHGGPALSFWQVEPATLDDAYVNYLDYRPGLRDLVERHRPPAIAPEQAMVQSLSYACAVARIVYYRAPESLPRGDDARALAQYWKTHFNTVLGAGKAPEAEAWFRRAVLA